jgi:hypothetical protein
MAGNRSPTGQPELIKRAVLAKEIARILRDRGLTQN